MDDKYKAAELERQLNDLMIRKLGFNPKKIMCEELKRQRRILNTSRIIWGIIVLILLSMCYLCISTRGSNIELFFISGLLLVLLLCQIGKSVTSRSFFCSIPPAHKEHLNTISLVRKLVCELKDLLILQQDETLEQVLRNLHIIGCSRHTQISNLMKILKMV